MRASLWFCLALAISLLAACGSGGDPPRSAAPAPGPALGVGSATAPAAPPDATTDATPTPVTDAGAVKALRIQRIQPLAGEAKAGQEVFNSEDSMRPYVLSDPWIDIPAINADGTRDPSGELAKIVRALSDPGSIAHGYSTNCFEPGIAIRIGEGAAQRTFLVCLMCDKIERVATPAAKACEWMLSEDGCDRLKAVYVDVFLLSRR